MIFLFNDRDVTSTTISKVSIRASLVSDPHFCIHSITLLLHLMS